MSTTQTVVAAATGVVAFGVATAGSIMRIESNSKQWESKTDPNAKHDALSHLTVAPLEIAGAAVAALGVASLLTRHHMVSRPLLTTAIGAGAGTLIGLSAAFMVDDPTYGQAIKQTGVRSLL
jgi:hypothetical protein